MTKSELERMARSYWGMAGKMGFVSKPRLEAVKPGLGEKAWRVHDLLCEIASELEELADGKA